MSIETNDMFKVLIDELYNTPICDDKNEDSKIKKMIANVVIGLLEKSFNKVQNSKLYDSLDIAMYHQKQDGGHIGLLQKTTSQKMMVFDRLDGEMVEDLVYNIEDLEYYILTNRKRTKLTNGFRFIKELLIQYHNFKMHSDYNTLIDNNIKVYSVNLMH